MPMGGDWALTDANNVNGSLTANVRQTFKTDDGAFIQVFETGQLQPDGTAFVRLAYETGSPKYYWLNSIVAIGIIRLVSATELSIDTWQVSGHDRPLSLPLIGPPLQLGPCFNISQMTAP